eukprot:jgi/Mesen1/7927/ME000422S07082
MALSYAPGDRVKLFSATGAALFLIWSAIWAFVACMIVGGHAGDPAATRVGAKFLSAVVALVWIGMVFSVSCMAAWLKYTAPLVTMPVAMSIGGVVFSALNKAELAHAAALACAALVLGPGSDAPLPTLCCVVGLCGIVLAQLLVVLPALCRKTCHVIAHASPREVPPCAKSDKGKGKQESDGSAFTYGPWFHAVYIFLEVVKLEMLVQVAVWGLGPAFALASRLSS